MHYLTCEYCKGSFEARRRDARTCSDACRQAASRASRGVCAFGVLRGGTSEGRKAATGGGWLGPLERQAANRALWKQAQERRKA